MVNNAKADENKTEDRMPGRGGQKDSDAPRSGSEILHEATEQTARTLNDALSEAARMGAQRMTHAAQEMIENLDLHELPRRAKDYARRNPLQFAAIGIAAAVLIGLIMRSRHAA